MDTFLPTNLVPSEVEWRLLDSTASFASPLSGAVRTVSRPGAQRWACRLTYKNLLASDRAQLLSLASRLRGKVNRLVLGDISTSRRGSFSSSELLTNNTFANGTTGWTLNTSSDVVLSSSDRLLRATLATNSGTGRVIVPTAAATLVQYASYVLRAMAYQGQGVMRYDIRLGATAGGIDYGNTAQITEPSLLTLAAVPYGTSGYFGLTDWSSGKSAGDYFETPYLSLSRGALVDNSPNALLRSDEFDNAAWTKAQSTITANSTTGPDGTSTADSLIETATTSAHYVTQAATKTAAAQDWCGAVFAKANTRTQVAIQIGEVSTNFARVIISLSDGSVVSAATNAGTVTNPRAYVKSMGDGWYYIAMIANIPSTITTTNACLVMLASAGSTSYAGNGTNGIYIKRGGYAQSSVPFRVGQTTSSALASGTTQSGSAIRVKGLPVSTNGLLEIGDMAAIAGELKRVTARLNSDAAGMGYLQFEPSLRSAPADNAAIVIHEPMGKFLLNADEIGWPTRPGLFSDFTLDLVEAVGN